MSMDFRKTTYRPNRPHTRLRTSYGVMSKWMALSEGTNLVKRPDVPTSLYIQEHEQREPPFLFPKLRDTTRKEDSDKPAEYGRLDVPLTLPQLPMAEKEPVHLQYSHQAGYDDFHKAYRHFDSHAQPVTFPVLGPPRLRYGRAGGSWRHVKEVMQARGKRALFVDGQMRTEDNDRLDEVPWGNMLQPPARPELLSRGYTCPAPGDFHTTRGTYPQDPTLAEPVGSGYAQDNWMAAR